MQANTREAIALFGELTSGFYDAYRLAGSSQSTNRQRIMTIAYGRKIPKANCGVNVIREWFFDAVKPDGECLAARETDAVRKVASMGITVHPNAI